jgi:hypothetical protein
MRFQIEWAVARGVPIFPVKVTASWPQPHVGKLVNGLYYCGVKEPKYTVAPSSVASFGVNELATGGI